MLPSGGNCIQKLLSQYVKELQPQTPKGASSLREKDFVMLMELNHLYRLPVTPL